jgi:UDP-4-amino-4,6-dideoxy-N-acetyl-beta-L-altrosamine transaminase
MNQIPYGRQHITEKDINAVIDVLKSDYLTQGPKIAEFETAFAEYIGCKYAVAVSNATAGLHLSVLALNTQAGDKVITTPITFAASANCVRYCGGEVLFADIDPTNYLLDINKVRDLLQASPKGTYKGIIPVNFAGCAVDMEEFRILADEFDFWIIEDACHAPGGYFFDRNNVKQNCGNGAYADLAVFSFHPVKHIATGEGGMITTNDFSLYQKLMDLRTHGITRTSILYQNSIDFARGEQAEGSFNESVNEVWPGWYMEMQSLGYNYRLTDFQAALGISQLGRAEDGIKKRRYLAERYNDAFNNQPFVKGHSGIIEGHAYHLYILEVENRLGLYNWLKENNIYAQVHYIPCHLMPYYRQFGWKEGDLPNAEAYYEGCLSLPMYPTLTEEEQHFVIETIFKYYGE